MMFAMNNSSKKRDFIEENKLCIVIFGISTEGYSEKNYLESSTGSILRVPVKH